VHDSPRWPIYTPDAIRDLPHIAAENIHVEFRKNPLVEELERQMSTLFRRRFAVATNSGTSALSAAYFALGLRPGANVIAPAYTYYATASAMLPFGFVANLVDCDADTLNVDVGRVIRDGILSNADAIVLTHNWGNRISNSDFNKLRTAAALPVIDDCSHLCGLSPDDEYFSAEVRPNISVVSLGARKIVSGGAAGVLLTDDERIYDRVIAFCQPKRNHLYTDAARKESLSFLSLGMNFRVSPFSARLAIDHLRHLSEIRSLWRGVAQEVSMRIASMGAAKIPQHSGSCCWYKVPVICETDDAMRLTEALDGLGVSVDQAVKPFFELPGFPAHTRADLSVYQALAPRLFTVDLSVEVGRRYSDRVHSERP
jgi:perosamine synthetase